VSHGWPSPDCPCSVERLSSYLLPYCMSSASAFDRPIMPQESWPEVCAHCADLISRVPPSVLLGALIATLLGAFVLVSAIYLTALPSSPLHVASLYPCSDGASLCWIIPNLTIRAGLYNSLSRCSSAPRCLAGREEIPSNFKGWIDHGPPAITLLARVLIERLRSDTRPLNHGKGRAFYIRGDTGLQ
jgi:hypothetical protein